jgi:hypothetical protein
MVSRLRLSFSSGTSSADLAADMDRYFTSEEIVRRAQTMLGRRMMFREAGMMLEMADYAERNSGAEVAPLVARLRTHAITIRMGTAKSLVGLKGTLRSD